MKEIFEYQTKTAKIENDKIELIDVKKTIEFEFNELAKQANFSIRVTSGGTSVLCSVVAAKEDNPNIPSEPLVPLIVDYRERTYAAGKIPGGFFKREGKPREHEVHVSRLIDRTLRPLFPKDFNRDVQLTVLVLSFDPTNDPTVLAVLGSSLVLSLSDIPFEGYTSCFRICKINNEYIVNPTFQELEISDIDLICGFYRDRVLMIETEAEEVEEQEIVNMIKFLQKYVEQYLKFQQELIGKYAKPKIKVSQKYNLEKLIEINRPIVQPKLEETLILPDKVEREKRYRQIVKEVVLSNEYCDEEIINDNSLSSQLKERILFSILRDIVRKYILTKQLRIDNRGYDELREIDCKINVLPRTHGSAIFQRGQTQALVTVTLGTAEDMQIMDELIGEYKERFLFHYNFPGFATGEVRPERGVSRRELGHGMLAKKAIQAVLPSKEEFPYTIRIVSDILESNGSSSMASVCGASLALLDAGVNIKKPVAGVAMGLVMESDNNYAILTDIAGIEDHCGDMDFKVAGTDSGVTAIQLDLKILGIPVDVVEETLLKAKAARLKILDIMRNVIASPREQISSLAPRVQILYIPPNKIGDLIGPKGKNIKQIIDSTQVKIEIENDGKITVFADSQELLDLAIQKINELIQDVEVGRIYVGKIKKITNYGLFVEVLPNKVGLLHVSQMTQQKGKSLDKIFSEGEEIVVKVAELDEEGRPVLTQKGIHSLGSKNNGQ
jgi:polyribonucleotide nucleotidyltransferase